MAGVTVHCTHCSAPLKLNDRSRLGSKVKCPKCAHPFVLTEEEDEWAGLEPVGPASRGSAPVVRRSKRSGGGSKMRRKSSSGMSGATLGLLIAGGVVLLLVVAGVGLWAAGVFSTGDGPVVVHNDADAAALPDPAGTSPTEAQPATPTNPPPAEPPSAQATPTSPPLTEPPPTVVATESPQSDSPPSSEPPAELLSDEEAQQMVRETLDSFLLAVVKAEDEDVFNVMRTYFVDEETTKRLFGTLGDDVWTASEELQAEVFSASPKQIRGIFNLILATETQFDLVDRRQQQASPKLQPVFEVITSDALIYQSRMTADQGGQQRSEDFLDWVVIDGEVRALPPLDAISSKLESNGKLAMSESRPRVSVSEATLEEPSVATPFDPSDFDFTHGPRSAEEAQAAQQFWADKLGREIVEENSLGMKLVLIPPGKYLMGAPRSEYRGRFNSPDIHEVEQQHPVTISKPFYFGMYEVTTTEFRTATGKQAGLNFGDDVDDSRFPVTWVTMEQVQAFLDALSEKENRTYRLPTEAEWEYACRAGTTTPFWTGPTIDGDQLNCHAEEPYLDGKPGIYRKTPTNVGSFRPNPFGLFDVHGNVAELCSDWYERKYYARSPDVDPPGPEKPTEDPEHLARGGGYHAGIDMQRSAVRWDAHEDGQADQIGFRVVMEP